MGVVVIQDKVAKPDIKVASEDYGDYVKVAVDVKKGAMAIGGEWHADAERELIKLGSRQEDIWGGGVNSKNRKVDYNALINIRPNKDNDSMEIINQSIKDKFAEVVKNKFGT